MSKFLIRELKQVKRDNFLLLYVGKPCEAVGFFDSSEDAVKALESIGAMPDWFSTVLCEGDHTSDCEGFAIREDGKVKRAFLIEEFILKELK